MIATTYHAPMGDIELVADERGLTGLWFADARPAGLPDTFFQVDAADLFAGDGHDVKAASAEYIEGMDIESGSFGMTFEEQRNAAAVGVIERTWGWLNSYFAGHAPLWIPPLHLEGDELAHDVWTALLAVPYGETITCAGLAERVSARGTATDAASVAAVLSSSPINLIVPIHRVLNGSDLACTAALRLWESKQ